MSRQIKDKLEWMFSDLIFEEKEHQYFVNGTCYPSVSSLIHGFETIVDFHNIAVAVAKKNKKSVKQVKQEWDKIKEEACTLGTNTHLFAENYNGTQEPINELEKAAKKFFDDLPDHYEVITKELRMYHREFRYAGTADLLLLDKRTNSIVIADFKTNKDLIKSYQYLMPPFEELEQSPLNKYKLQLSYYQIMIEQSGIEVSNRVIIWLRRDGEYEIIPTPDYTKTLRDCLQKKESSKIHIT